MSLLAHGLLQPARSAELHIVDRIDFGTALSRRDFLELSKGAVLVQEEYVYRPTVIIAVIITWCIHSNLVDPVLIQVAETNQAESQPVIIV